MWCELVLNGIGGRTIFEAQQNIGYQEYLTWCAYRKKRGTLNQGLRLDQGIALLASMYANTHSKNGGHTMQDFMPFHDEPELDLESAMETWK